MSSSSQRTWMVLNPKLDNVAIALRPFEAGEKIEGVKLTEPIRQYHKVALKDIPQDEPVHKYGQILGMLHRRSQPAPGSTHTTSAWAD